MCQSCTLNFELKYNQTHCEQGVKVDNDLFNNRYSTKSLIPDSNGRGFRVDVYIKNKEDWIFKYGSDLIQQSLRAGYDCNEGYLAERLPRDYPGFTIHEWSKYKKVDTPNEKCLHACLGYEYSYCSIDKKNYYITIDNYLGKYQLVKFIDPNLEITRIESLATIGDVAVKLKDLSAKMVDSSIEVTDDKKAWIIEYGSDLLQQSFLAGYDCNNRYLQERIIYEYPGFEIATRNYPKVDSPDENCLYACLGYENAYCSSTNQCYYVTINNYLRKYQLIKQIDILVKVIKDNSTSKVVIINFFRTKIGKYLALTSYELTNTDLIVIIASTTTILVGLSTLLYIVLYAAQSSV